MVAAAMRGVMVMVMVMAGGDEGSPAATQEWSLGSSFLDCGKW